jgi:Rubisco Assembly chaperone C-terminal domain/Rubisco accumulation factor 1 alpha helical domain/Rubisco accumulation factor 1 helix turn helix domain
MTDTPQKLPYSSSDSPLTATETEELIKMLRRKEQTWVDWGHACSKLLKAGYSAQAIFEETGFEPIQQNQVSVAAQVYTSLVNGDAPQEARSHFLTKGSDVLYEFRILTQAERVAAASLALSHKLDCDEARDVAKAVKDFSRLGVIPQGFSSLPGDTVAFQCWKYARQQSDLQTRSRLIARGLKFAQTPEARQQLEQLLMDFTVVAKKTAPRLPIHRFETDEESPRIIAIAGELPLSTKDWNSVPLLEPIEPFQLVKFNGVGALIAIPGWQVIRYAEDPIGLLGDSQNLPTPILGLPEQVLIVVDRSQRQWKDDSYFIYDNNGQIEIQWFEDLPEHSLLGRVLLIMRPKKIILEDGSLAKEVWQIDD